MDTDITSHTQQRTGENDITTNISPDTSHTGLDAPGALTARITVRLTAAALAVVAAVLALAAVAEPALAQGGSAMDIEGAATDLIAIAAAVILAVIFLRVIPDLGKRAYAGIAILLVIGGCVYYLALNPESLEAIGQFFGDLLNL